jgi:hypothetical protein
VVVVVVMVVVVVVRMMRMMVDGGVVLPLRVNRSGLVEVKGHGRGG